MIRIESITIREFRGIRDLSLKLNGQNFAACGPNGTGKSGIVDAIEFALTGHISRLSGAGTGGLSVKSHGPHVDLRDKPENAVVILEVTIPSLAGKRARITRSVKAAGTPKIEPNDPEVLRAFSKVAAHPEFVLSRRELIRYVLSEPGERSKAVMALLRLEEIEKLRAVLQKIANAEAKRTPQLSRLKEDAGKHLAESLGISGLATAAMLDAVNGRRRLLGLADLVRLEAGTSLREGLVATEASAPPRVTKIQASDGLRLFISALERLRAAPVEEIRTRALASAITLEGEGKLADLDRESMLKSALVRYDGSLCPVCDTAFAPGAFEAHLSEKLARLEEVGKLRSSLEADVEALKAELESVGSALNTMIGLTENLPRKIGTAALRDLVVVLRGRYGQLMKLTPISDTRAVLEVAASIPDLGPLLAEIRSIIDAMPERKRSLCKEELQAIYDMRAFVKTWSAPDHLKQRIRGTLGGVADISALRALKSLGIGDAESIETWKKMRNSVAHGELVSPYSSEEQDGALLALARLFHDLTKDDVRRVLARK